MGKILIVDDDNLVRLAICENLKDWGFSAVEASNGKDAVQIFLKENPASVILDLKMPGMDGLLTIYIHEHSDAEISHGMCSDYAKILYPKYFTKPD